MATKVVMDKYGRASVTGVARKGIREVLRQPSITKREVKELLADLGGCGPSDC